MSLDKSIQSGKSHRKPYRGAKAIDATCRNHGSCKWCEGNRTHKNDKRELAAEQELKECVLRECSVPIPIDWMKEGVNRR